MKRFISLLLLVCLGCQASESTRGASPTVPANPTGTELIASAPTKGTARPTPTTSSPDPTLAPTDSRYERYTIDALRHGTADQTISIASAQRTCQALTDAGVEMECIYYPDEDHTFRSRVEDDFYGSMLSFYQKYLAP